MINCIIISSGEKIKNLRKKYNVKQEDITGEDITRNLISEIEHNKVKVSRNTAEVILKHLNKLAAERGFAVEETVDYLIEDELSQASKILDEFIEELKTLSIYKDNEFINTLSAAENFLIKWDIKDKKIAIYELAGDYFCNKNDMYKSVVYYEKVLALIGKLFLSKSLLNVLRKLSMVYNYVGDYKKGIECCEFALTRFEDTSQKDRVVFLYNNALNYKRIDNFEKALNNFNEAEGLVDKSDITSYIMILNNKGNCFYEMKKYEEALDIFSHTLDLIDKNNAEQCIINLINIFNCYWFLNLQDKAMENFEVLLKQMPNLNNFDEYLPEIYFEVGKIYDKLNKLNITEEYYLKALEYSEKQKNYVLENHILYALIEIYMIGNKVEKMNKIKEKAFFIANRQGKINNEIMYKLMIFYSKISNEVIEIGNFALNFK